LSKSTTNLDVNNIILNKGNKTIEILTNSNKLTSDLSVNNLPAAIQYQKDITHIDKKLDNNINDQ